MGVRIIKIHCTHDFVQQFKSNKKQINQQKIKAT